jgi:ribosomal protein S16
MIAPGVGKAGAQLLRTGAGDLPYGNIVLIIARSRKTGRALHSVALIAPMQTSQTRTRIVLRCGT